MLHPQLLSELEELLRQKGCWKMTCSPKLFQRPPSLKVQPINASGLSNCEEDDNTSYFDDILGLLNNREADEGRKLEQFVANELKPSFHTLLFGYIDNMELADTDVYRRAGIDRRLSVLPNYPFQNNPGIIIANSAGIYPKSKLKKCLLPPGTPFPRAWFEILSFCSVLNIRFMTCTMSMKYLPILSSLFSCSFIKRRKGR